MHLFFFFKKYYFNSRWKKCFPVGLGFALLSLREQKEPSSSAPSAHTCQDSSNVTSGSCLHSVYIDRLQCSA